MTAKKLDPLVRIQLIYGGDTHEYCVMAPTRLHRIPMPEGKINPVKPRDGDRSQSEMRLTNHPEKKKPTCSHVRDLIKMNGFL